jgi:hypothetical protein
MYSMIFLEQLRNAVLQDAHLLNISANDIHGPPPAGLHDRQNANATRHHVLRGGYSHGVPRECPDEGLIKTRLGRHRLDGPIDSERVEAGIADPIALDLSEYPAGNLISPVFKYQAARFRRWRRKR